jgi:hypothetical protein
MAKRQASEAPPHTDEDRGAPDQSATGYNPFLKVENISAHGATELRLTGWVRRTIGRYGPQIVIEVTTPDGRTFDFGIKEGSPNHRMIFRGMGRDETKWEGRLIVEVGQFTIGTGARARKSNPAVDIREVIADNPPF